MPSNSTTMTEALRLTRAGKYLEAAAVLRNGLDSLGEPSKSGSDKVIDIIAEPIIRTPRQTETSVGSDRHQSSFEDRQHAGVSGSIGYMLYRPNKQAGMPLVVMLHGCTQSPEDFARGTAMNALADELGFLVAYPRQTSAANAQKCWNWFRPDDQKRGQGEPALIAGIVRDIVAEENADASRVYVAGLSAGGAAAAILADAYPDVFAAVGIHSGLAAGAARNMPSAFKAMQHGGAGLVKKRSGNSRFVPVITFHGDRDKTVNERNAGDIVRVASASIAEPVTVDIERGTSGGRSYSRALSRDAQGRVLIEQWTVAGAGHAWSGGDPSGTYTDAQGPDAARALLRFFLQHRNLAS